jgi:hypothetical protein
MIRREGRKGDEISMCTGGEGGFGSDFYSRFNFGAGTKGLSSTWPEMLAGDTPFSPGWYNQPRQKGCLPTSFSHND